MQMMNTGPQDTEHAWRKSSREAGRENLITMMDAEGSRRHGMLTRMSPW